MRTSLTAFFLLAALPSWAQTPVKKPLDHSVYDNWKAIGQTAISRDGKYVAYVINPQEGDGELTVRRNSDGRTVTIARGTGLRFSQDSRYLAATITPPFAETREARRAKKKPDEMPKPGLTVVDLERMAVTEIPRVSQWSLATDDRGWIAYRPDAPKPAPTKPDAPKTPEAPAEPAKKDDAPKKKADHRAGDVLAVAPLAAPNAPTNIPDVSSFVWSKDGSRLVYALSTKDGKGDGVGSLTFTGAQPRTEPLILSGLGRYTKLTTTNSGDRVAFLTDRDDYAAKKPIPSLYLWENGRAVRVEAPKNAQNWIVNGDTTPRFSESGRRLLYGIGPKPVDPAETPDDEKVAVDIWNWKDTTLMPQQLLQARSEGARTYLALREGNRNVLLADEEIRDVTVPGKGDGPYGLAEEERPYGSLRSWDGSYSDVYRVDLNTGAKTRFWERLRGVAVPSPDGRWVAIIDDERQKIWAVDLQTLRQTELSTGTVLFNELSDVPDFPGAYGFAWTKDNRVLLDDRWDIWLVDPTGKQPAKALTSGRTDQIKYNRIPMGDLSDGVDPNDLFIKIFVDRSKDMGFFRLQNGKTTAYYPPVPAQQLGWAKADNADTFIFREGTTVRYPEIRVTDTTFRNPVVITSVGEQIKPYNWLTSELVTWTSNDGVPLQGILYKPENFDASKKYPMISYFYERNSDNLHTHYSPAPSASVINIPLFVSQGYLVFVPDIVYKVGYPGESAVSSVVSGVNALLQTRSYVDPKRLGIQGQSWGGYQVAYLITETNMFAAAGAGAPVSNMTSAYGGIRYGSGMVRQFQYERQQSRIGGTPWNALQRYIENSPLFFADKVNTPLLIMHNDKDGAVPWTQGIELFTALRRLQKPVWMLVYNDEDHNLVQRKNRKDLSIRLSQFFDHFLKGAPEPVWMERGVPAVEKGRTMGTELVTPGTSAKP